MSRKPRRRRPPRRISTPLLLALISAGAIVVAALIGAVPKLLEWSRTNENVQRLTPGPGRTDRPTSSPDLNERSTPVSGVGRIAGMLSDRAGNPIGDMSVGIRNGPQAQTDSRGKFVVNEAPAGDQTVEVRSPSTKGQLTQNIRVEPGQTTSVNIVYDAGTSRLGLLSITAPVDSSLLALRHDGNEYRAEIYGRCDGLQQILGQFDVWVLVSSESDSRYWVQQPSALVDPSDNTWRAKALFGSPENPPRDNQRWDIVAVAASSGSGIGRVINTPSLNLLPSHISSNTVSVETKIK